jgi:hypothetical protein
MGSSLARLLAAVLPDETVLDPPPWPRERALKRAQNNWLARFETLMRCCPFLVDTPLLLLLPPLFPNSFEVTRQTRVGA